MVLAWYVGKIDRAACQERSYCLALANLR